MDTVSEAPQKSCCTSCCWKFADRLYDCLAAFISMSDFATDVMVVIDFYVKGKMTYFWMGISVFLFSNFIYTIFMVAFLLNDDSSACTFCVLLLLLLPFGELFPILIWLDSFEFQCWVDLKEFFGISGQAPRFDNHAIIDPWLEYLLRKAISHFGFFLEGLIEAIPMSIIQMIAIVQYQEVSTVNVVSLMISLVSIGSKAIIASYSPHRPTSAFNFLCIFADLFKFFAILSWAFRNPDISTTMPFFLFRIEFDWLCYIWILKEFCVFSFFTALGLGLWVALIRSMYLDRPDENCMLCFIAMLMFLFCSMALVPFLITLEMFFGFSLFPLLMMEKNMEWGKTGTFVNSLASDLVCGFDRFTKLFVYNKAVVSLTPYPHLLTDDYPQIGSTQIQKLRDARMPEELPDFRKPVAPVKAYREILSEFVEIAKGHHPQQPIAPLYQHIPTVLFFGFILIIWIPLFLLFALYSAILPMLLPFIYEGTVLQLVLSYTYITIFGILLILLPLVYLFLDSMGRMHPVWRNIADNQGFSVLRSKYDSWTQTIEAEQFILQQENFPLPVNNIILSFLPPQYFAGPADRRDATAKEDKLAWDHFFGNEDTDSTPDPPVCGLITTAVLDKKELPSTSDLSSDLEDDPEQQSSEITLAVRDIPERHAGSSNTTVAQVDVENRPSRNNMQKMSL